MTLRISTEIHHVVRPNEALFSGYGLTARGTTIPVGFDGVGGAVLMTGPTTIEKYGLPTKVTDVLHFHVRALRNISTGICSLTAWLSAGPVCDSALDPSLATPCIDYILNNEFKSLSVKKRTNGSLGNFLINQAPTPLGNYIKLFEEQMVDTQFTEFYNEVKTYYGPLFSENQLLTTEVGQLRECDVHLRPQIDDVVTVKWQAAYTAEANEETLWLLDNAGNLITEIRIYENELEGQRQFPVKAGQTYRFVVPGYSFRNYSLVFEQSMRWMLEPVKLHFFGTLGADSRFFFKVLANEAATFCMKDYNQGSVEGPFAATLTRLEDSLVIPVVLETKTWFYEHDSFVLPPAVIDATWKCELQGAGRTAIWLDGPANYFADSASTYFRPTPASNDVQANTPTFIPASSVGKVPLFGHYFPYTVVPPGSATDLFTRMKAQTANIYSFMDVMAANPNHENVIREDMNAKFGVTRDYTIAAKTGRVSLFNFATDVEAQNGLTAWINNIHRINDGKEHFIAAADEPNLGYPTFESYRESFLAFANQVRNNPKSAQANIKISAAATSRFDHGTTTSDSFNRKGLTWAQQLVDLYPTLIDAIVWHDWTVHGLLNTRQYTTAIEAAYALSNNGARRLCIEQTNTSGGSSVSLYHQNTQFATLWWAGIFCAATRTGKLDDLNWFLDHDEINHPKGLVFTISETEYSMKIVGLFQEWLASYLTGASQGVSYPIEQPKIEVDLCAFTNVKAAVTRKFIMGVNKSIRSYSMLLPNFNWGTSGVILTLFNPNGTTTNVVPTINVGAQTCAFTLPAETVFMLSQGVV